MSVTVCLEDEIDISRGDMLVPPRIRRHGARRFEATLVWMNEKPAAADRPYLLKHTTQTLPARIVEIRHRIDIHTLGEHSRRANCSSTKSAPSWWRRQRPLFFDPYRRNRIHRQFHPDRPDHQRDGGRGHDPLSAGRTADGAAQRGDIRSRTIRTCSGVGPEAGRKWPAGRGATRTNSWPGGAGMAHRPEFIVRYCHLDGSNLPGIGLRGIIA